MKHNAKTLLLSGMAALLVAGMAVTPSMSYFTTYVQADGSKDIHLERVIPEFEEKYENGTKNITAHNIGGAPCYVRVMAFAGNGIALSYTSDGDAWFAGEDGYYYYKEVLQPEEISTVLHIAIEDEDKETLRQDYNVTVIIEAAPIFYNAEGNVIGPNEPNYEGWSLDKYIIKQTYDKNGETGGDTGDTGEGETGDTGEDTGDETGGTGSETGGEDTGTEGV